jgi:hypothetical protein
MVQATPFSQGMSSHLLSSSHHTQSHYAPYIAHDLQKMQDVSLETFFDKICGCDDEWRASRGHLWDRVANELTAERDAYAQAKTSERASYAPYVILGNKVLDILGHTTIRYCRNDPKHMAGSPAERSPDIVIVPTDVLTANRTVEHCNSNGPDEPFWWHNVHACHEVAPLREVHGYDCFTSLTYT